MVIFWVVAGALALVVAAILTRALRQGGKAAPAAGFDLQVYRDQLREVERDGDRGVIAPDEAERLRTEVARRLLEADRALARAAPTSAEPPSLLGSVAIGVVALILAASFAGYVILGTPGMPDEPIDARIAVAEARRADRPAQAAMEAAQPPAVQTGPIDPDFTKLVVKLREAVAERPDDLKGHELLARNEANLGNFDAAWRAQAQVIALKGNAATVADSLLQATLMIQAAGGRISPEVEHVLRDVLARDPNNGTALYFLGIDNLQVGRHDLAFRYWRQLLETAAPDNLWAADVRGRIADLAELAGVRYQPPEPAMPGPDATAMQDAAQMSPEDRQAMIRNMVEGLSDRLASQGGSAQEWARLITSLGTLGEMDRAEAIWGEAQKVFADRPGDLAVVHAAAQETGLVK